MTDDQQPKIPPKIGRLSTKDGFVEAFWEYVPQSDTYKEAFYKVAAVHMEWYGFERYAGYYSFKKEIYRGKRR